MKEFYTISFDGTSPIVATAIHDGHKLSDELLELSALKESERLREEDPYTGKWTEIVENRIIAHHSRFEFDLNRPPERAIYLVPEDAWGLTVWKRSPPAEALHRTMDVYSEFYNSVHSSLSNLVKKHGKIVVLDLHSYNHRRNGPDAAPEDALLNPEINLGTGTMDREYWTDLVDRFINELGSFKYSEKSFDVRENIKFKGGYFGKWIHENFPESVCCISIEFKKFFMDEWTGIPDHSMIRTIGEALKSVLPGLTMELSNRK